MPGAVCSTRRSAPPCRSSGAWRPPPPLTGRAAALGPASSSLSNAFYWVLRRLGRYAEAERELRAAAARDERSADPLAGLADLLVNQGRLDEARAACAAALAREP